MFFICVKAPLETIESLSQIFEGAPAALAQPRQWDHEINSAQRRQGALAAAAPPLGV
jgi:hypothetical protein